MTYRFIQPPMTPVESKFLHTLCRAWPREGTPGALLVNAAEIGRHLSLSEDESREIVQTLTHQGLLHVRVVEGVVLIHPTQEGLDYAGLQRGGFFAGLIKGLIPWRTRN